MGEQGGEGYFTEKGTFRDLAEGRELLSEARINIEEIKTLLENERDFLEMFNADDTSGKAKTLKRIEDYELSLAENSEKRRELATLYDRLYRATYGELPN